jgi:hypothetical protein
MTPRAVIARPFALTVTGKAMSAVCGGGKFEPTPPHADSKNSATVAETATWIDRAIVTASIGKGTPSIFFSRGQDHSRARTGP